MLLFHSRKRTPFCNGMTRREILRAGGLALGGLTLPQLLRAEDRAKQAGSAATGRKSILMIYLAGGPPHLDMFDMKPDAPAEVRGEFRPVATNVPGIQICEHFPRLARMADRFSIIRSLTGMQDRHESHWALSGYTEPQTNLAHHPALGSAVSYLHGQAAAGIPPFMSLSMRTQHAPWGNPGEPGFCGRAHAPFQTDGPGMDNMVAHMSADVLADRTKLLRCFDQFTTVADTGGAAAAMDDYQRQAFDIFTAGRLRTALELEREPAKVRDRYGHNNRNAVDDGPCADPQDFLRARRLIEAGVRCVTLSWCRWDWHGANFAQGKKYMPMLDQGLTALMEDLRDRGLEQDVPIVMWGEFGRTPRVNKDAGRDHWAPASFAFLAGGGLRHGQVIGSTNRYGERPADRPVSHFDVFSTLYHAMGIDVNTTTIKDPSGRPQYLVEGERKPIAELV